MKRKLGLLLVIFISVPTFSCPSLVGTWKSSKQLTLEHSDQYVNLSVEQWNVLRQLLGREVVTYTEETIHEHGIPPIEIELNGKKSEFVVEEATYPYKAITCYSKSAKIDVEYKNNEVIELRINFIGKDTYWIPVTQIPHAREYFVRANEN